MFKRRLLGEHSVDSFSLTEDKNLKKKKTENSRKVKQNYYQHSATINIHIIMFNYSQFLAINSIIHPVPKPFFRV